jgi:hypothetical protein
MGGTILLTHIFTILGLLRASTLCALYAVNYVMAEVGLYHLTILSVSARVTEGWLMKMHDL